MWDPKGVTPNIQLSNQELTAEQILNEYGGALALPATPRRGLKNKWYFEVRLGIFGHIFGGYC
jgi:hypothetical protein